MKKLGFLLIVLFATVGFSSCSKKDAKNDVDLHRVAENAIVLSETGKTLTIADYDAVVKNEAKELQERLRKLAGIIG